MQKMSTHLAAFIAASLFALPPLGAQQTDGTGSARAPGDGGQAPSAPAMSNAPGSNTVRPTPPATAAECLPSSEPCPTEGSSGEGVVTTDSQPLGSTVERGNGPGVDTSDYPTSTGAGAAGSGVSGTPTRPDAGPTLGIGR